MNMSPAQIAAAAEVLNKCNDYAKNTGCSNESKEKDANNEELLSLVNQIVAAMKGAN